MPGERLRVDGAVESPRTLGFDELAALPGQVADIGALVPGRVGGGVRLASLLDAVAPLPDARFAKLMSSDGKFSAWVPLDAVKEAVVVYRLGDAPLPEDKGGPMRFYIPDVEKCGVAGLDACANVKALGHVLVARQSGLSLHTR
jgi:DMSO/TMAO reductase YedYZ molybdopterin-dependent catalytic subunit